MAFSWWFASSNIKKSPRISGIREWQSTIDEPLNHLWPFENTLTLHQLVLEIRNVVISLITTFLLISVLGPKREREKKNAQSQVGRYPRFALTQAIDGYADPKFLLHSTRVSHNGNGYHANIIASMPVYQNKCKLKKLVPFSVHLARYHAIAIAINKSR